jgi:hypothetical protein
MIDRQLRVVAGKDRAATLKELFAKSGMPLGGYELKHRSEQRQPKDIVTASELAAMDFAPWKMDHPPGQPGPSRKVMDNLGVSARFAAAFVERSKSELIGMWQDEPNQEELFDLVDNLQEAAEKMMAMVAMVQTAHLRLLVAAHAVVEENIAEHSA